MDIWTTWIIKKKSLFYRILLGEKKQLFEIFTRNKTKVSFKKEKKKKYSKIRLIKGSTLFESYLIKFTCLWSMNHTDSGIRKIYLFVP